MKLLALRVQNLELVSSSDIKVKVSKAPNYFEHYRNSKLRPVLFELHATAFSFAWPWPWTHDLETKPWPRYFDDTLTMMLLGQAIQKYENSSQGQRSRSNVTNFQTLLAFTMGHIPIKLHRFPTSSFREFLRTDAQMHRQTDSQTDSTKNNTCSQHSWRAVIIIVFNRQDLYYRWY